ncbi:MAG: tetratricopeptide repeat protein [candidate division Zixibacteria bacterium]|nr:tetratricopeptide repeat protein [candidate division Zixibacteria bacterium]
MRSRFPLRPLLAAVLVASLAPSTSLGQEQSADEAQSVESQAAGYRPADEAIGHYGAGLKDLRAQDFRGAQIEFEQAVAADSSYGDAFYALGKTYLTLSQFDRAIGAFEQASRVGVSQERASQAIPSLLAQAYSKSGVNSYGQRKYREAIARFEKALELEPGKARTYYTLGLCHRGLRDEAAAKRSFELAIGAETGNFEGNDHEQIAADATCGSGVSSRRRRAPGR